MKLSHCHLSLETLFGRYACVDSKMTHRKDTGTVKHLQLRRAASQKVGCLFGSSHPTMHSGNPGTRSMSAKLGYALGRLGIYSMGKPPSDNIHPLNVLMKGVYLCPPKARKNFLAKLRDVFSFLTDTHSNESSTPPPPNSSK